MDTTKGNDKMMQAMIFAAGLGTRLKPLTDNRPKALVEVAGRPLLSHVLCRLKESGFSRVVVNVHHFAAQITDYLEANQNFGLDICISDESQALLDTGGGIKAAQSLFQQAPILVHNVDILSNVDLGRFYTAYAGAQAALLVSERKTRRYLLFNDQMHLVGWTNTDTGQVRSPYPHLRTDQCRMYAFAGIHIFSPRLFPLMQSYPDAFGIIDFYLDICSRVKIVGHVEPRLQLMDVGKQDTLAQADAFAQQLQQHRPEK